MSLFAAALWWGSLTAVGFLVVPLLFKYLPSPAMAGGMAAKLFSAQTWVSVVCGVVLVLTMRGDPQDAVSRLQQRVQMLAIAGLLLTLLVEFAVAPRIVARDNLALWHRLGSVLYLLQWLCAGAALWAVSARSRT